MSVIAFNFTRIAAERKARRIDNCSIRNETNVTDIKAVPIGKQQALVFTFTTTIFYEPALGSIEIGGEVVSIASDEDAKRIPAEFQKTKVIDPKYMGLVYNEILTRATLQAIIVARDLSLPAPIQMPRLDLATAAAVAKAREHAASIATPESAAPTKTLGKEKPKKK